MKDLEVIPEILTVRGSIFDCMLSVVLIYYAVPLNLMVVAAVAFTATVFEGITPKGLDNLTACFSAVGVYLLMGVI